MKSRTIERMKVIQFLYSLDFKGSDFSETYKMINLENEPLAKQIIEFYIDNHDKVNSVIQKNLNSWKLNRLNYTDRAIIRAGTCELMIHETDKAVIINEFVDISKIYGQHESPFFINGILDGLDFLK